MNTGRKIAISIGAALIVAWGVAEQRARNSHDAVQPFASKSQRATDVVRPPSEADLRAMLSDKGAAPEVAIMTPTGKVSLSSLRGKVVLIDFWGTWCGPCRMSIPGLQRAYEARKGKGFEVLGVALEQDNGSEVPGFIREMGMTYPAGVVDVKAHASAYGFSGLPAMVLVDRSGRMRWAKEGYSARTEALCAQLIDALLAEPAPSGAPRT